jgi:SAM-dependent methyltransferase
MFARYAKFYDLLNQDKPYKKEIEFVHRWAARPKSILDIGCGTASYWKYFPKNTRILGVDKSPHMIGQLKFPPMTSIIEMDISKYRVPVKGKFDCVTALFDVLNYIPNHGWWKRLPLKRGGYFIFDIWDQRKVNSQGFEPTKKEKGGVSRGIFPMGYSPISKEVGLKILVCADGQYAQETHVMYVHGHDDIVRFCGKEFEIVDVKPTETWQTWYKLKRK